MNFFGGKRGGNHSHSHGPGQQCSHDHGSAAAAGGGMLSYPAGGALGQGQQSSSSSSTRVAQPGMEMMPTSQQQPSGLDGLPLGGGGDGGDGGGTIGMENIGQHLQGAPADVLAAAERLSLISPMMLGAGGGGAGGVMDMDGMGGVVRTAPGAESTDTGLLSEATIASQLLVAVRSRDTSTLRRLCSSTSEHLSAALKRRDGQGHTLMHWAAKSGELEMLELLANSGCPTNEFSTDAVGMTPLHWAATEGRLRASAWLLGPGGADPESRDNQGCTALVIAAQYGFVELVIYLSHHGCDPGSVDSVGDSAMHWAAYKGHVQVLSMLVKAGQDPEEEDVYGQTPLHLAALRGNRDAAEYLVIEARANVNARDKKNETPLDLARKKNQARNDRISAHSIDARMAIENGAGQSWLSPAVFLKLARTPRVWKAACETGEGVQGAGWPLPLNVVLTSFVMWMTLQRFFGEEYLSLGHNILLLVSTVAQLFMWLALFLTWASNPGFVDPTDPKVSLAFHRRVGVLTGEKGKGTTGIEEDLGHGSYSDLDIEDPSSSLMGLESGAGSVASSACYTCSIERPLRSRHCRNCRRCVRAFDHHCAFVGNCVGAGNYRWFFSYIVCLVLSTASYTAMCVDWLWHLGLSVAVVVSAAYAVFFGCFGILLFVYHAQLIRQNLTTSEHHALGRVDYLAAPNQSGQYYNPFDQGCVDNCLARVSGTHDTPPPGLLARLRATESPPARRDEQYRMMT
ncbi:unnamed protein product [Pylaiella littoralis]